MLLWVGLGNPGREHARQRHNIGFMALDAIARRHGFGPWRSRFKGEIAEGSIAGQRITLLKPQTYMNASGQSVQPAAAFHKIPPSDVWAFHDELDLAPGKVRVKRGGGAAGHNGLRDMQRAWIAWRDATCAFEAGEYAGGTLAGTVATGCMMQRTGDQVLWLAGELDRMERQ